MTERDALLAAILSSPGDDTPRLIYADWLEERGDVERAEFIRVQVEIASREDERDRCITCVRPGEQHHNGPCRSPLKGIMHRARELFGQSWKWVPEPLSKLQWGIERYGMSTRHFIDAEADRNLDLCWRRGFVAELQCSWADWLRHHERLFWSPRQTVECPACHDTGWVNGYCCYICGKDEDQGTRKMGTGRIPRPFVNTAQPITEVRITDWAPNHLHGDHVSADGYRFVCVKCGVCDGNGSWMANCPDCNGRPLNRWGCEAWPGVQFVMPMV